MKQCELPWTITEPSTELIFLDIKISLNIKSGKITISTYEKEQNLHTYLPPYSAHAPGVLKRLIFGFVHCYWLHNKLITDYARMITKFVGCLKKWGHNLCTIKSLIMEAANYFERKMQNKKYMSNNKTLQKRQIMSSFIKPNFTLAEFLDCTYIRHLKPP